MKYLFLLLLLSVCPLLEAQDSKAIYQNAFLELKGMLEDSIPSSFKRAVFITENAYLNGRLSYDAYHRSIQFFAKLCGDIAEQNPIVYAESDRIEVNKYASVFRLMTDTIKFDLDTSSHFVTKPFSYDFDDFWGEKRWEKMFVSKLLETHSGNCHSLPFLYKILCEELGAKAYLAMAPNHIYIKQWTKATGWFNTELTGGYFPIDAWIMASGYIHLNAVQNRLYMDTLSQKQSIAVCMIDLAKGFERKVPGELAFLEMCTDQALKYYPNYTNALVLKAETTKKKFEQIMVAGRASYPSDILNQPHAKMLFSSMEDQYLRIHQSGYRMMPKEMYLQWLGELKKEKDKYSNKAAVSNLQQQHK